MPALAQAHSGAGGAVPSSASHLLSISMLHEGSILSSLCSIVTLPLRLWRRQLCPTTVIGPSTGGLEGEDPHHLQEARG